jgi:hypothetical protein
MLETPTLFGSNEPRPLRHERENPLRSTRDVGHVRSTCGLMSPTERVDELPSACFRAISLASRRRASAHRSRGVVLAVAAELARSPFV